VRESGKEKEKDLKAAIVLAEVFITAFKSVSDDLPFYATRLYWSWRCKMRWFIRQIDSSKDEVQSLTDFPPDIPRSFLRDAMVSMMRTVTESEPRIMIIRDFGECWNDGDNIIITASLANAEEIG
jgi:hypothetical protein